MELDTLVNNPIKCQKQYEITNKSIANEILHTLQMWKFDWGDTEED